MIIHHSMIIAIIEHHIIETCTSMNSVNSNQIVKNIYIFCFWSEHLQYIHVFGNLFACYDQYGVSYSYQLDSVIWSISQMCLYIELVKTEFMAYARTKWLWEGIIKKNWVVI